MQTFRITVAYDGTDFVGWQRQAAGVSIQGLLEDALRELDGRDVTVMGAGRTDAGVHALGQVAAFAIERPLAANAVVRALNARLPDTVRVLSAEEAPASFRARADARSKTYRYRIWNGDVVSPFERRFVWHVPGALDVDAMRAAAQLLEGTHDFAAFQTAGSDVRTTERTILSSRIADGGLRIDWSNKSELVTYEVCGTGFLRHMVRAIAGSLVEVGRGHRSLAWMSDVLVSRDRGQAGPTAPARGLFLVSVAYSVVQSRFTPKEP
jgi:tRNA pseudouridine38-40 synthase